MTAFAPLLTVTLEHAYYGPDPVPARIVPRLTHEQIGDRAIVQNRGGTLAIFSPRDNEDAAATTTLALDLVWTDAEFFDVTGPISTHPVEVDLENHALGQIDLGAVDPVGRSAASPDGVVAQLLVSLSFATPSEAALTVRLPTIASHWTYHIVGGDPEVALSVQDQSSDAQFESVGSPPVPGSRVVRSFRSAAALPLSRRPTSRFDLVREGPFGPQTLISPLPAAAASTSSFSASGAIPRLQSEIFVTL